jgi:hypothetical protein
VVVERRVVLLSRDAGLASTVGRLLSNGDQITRFNSAAELTDWSTPEVAAVVLDSQPYARRLSYKQVRERYHGPLVMLLDKDERQPDLPPDGARRFLYRPFKVTELSSLLDAPMPRLGSLEAAIIAAWSRHAIAEQVVRPPRDPSYRVGSRRPSLPLWRRARTWAATIVALMGLLLVFGLGGQGGSCASGCTKFSGAIAGAAETEAPLTTTPSAGSAGGGQGGQPPGSSAASSQPPTSTGGARLPVITGVGGLIQSISPITGDDTTPPSGPEPVPGVPAPPGVTPPAATNPPGTAPPTTTPPTTTPPTTAPPTTEPPTTEPPTTAPPTTTPPPTSAPPSTEPPTTAPPTTQPPTTAAPTTEAPTTAPPTTAAPTTVETTAAPTT